MAGAGPGAATGPALLCLSVTANDMRLVIVGACSGSSSIQDCHTYCAREPDFLCRSAAERVVRVVLTLAASIRGILVQLRWGFVGRHDVW
jgi:hypothetical protein